MRAAIYVRISQDREGAGLGVKRQQADAEALCERLGWETDGVYVDNDLSAYSGKPRPEYKRLLADAATGAFGAIVAWHTDRLHRSPRELEEFIDVVERHGLAVEMVKGGTIDLSTPTGRLVARQLGNIARYESEHKSERIQRKMLELAQNGQSKGGGSRPYGFEPDRVTIRESEAAIIREAARQITDGVPLRSVARDLERRGLRSPTGKPWSATPLGRMLKSPRIAGLRQHRGEVIGAASWPAIITPQQRDRIVAILNDPARRDTGDRAPRRYLLKGLLRCEHCGHRMVSRPRTDGVRRYVCASGPGFHGCGKTTILAEPSEDHVVKSFLLERLRDPDFRRSLKGNGNGADQAANEADRLQAELDELAAARGAGEITMREWLAARKPLQQRADAARRKAAKGAAKPVLANFAALAKANVDAWTSLDFDAQHAVLSAAVEFVTVGPGRRGYNRPDPANRLTIKWWTLGQSDEHYEAEFGEDWSETDAEPAPDWMGEE
jgi:site-specific DNA recombinase